MLHMEYVLNFFHLFYVFMSIYLLRIRFMCIFIPSLLAWRSYCSLMCMLMTSEWINPIYIYYKSCISFSVHKFYGNLLQIICRIFCVYLMSNSFIQNEQKLYRIINVVIWIYDYNYWNHTYVMNEVIWVILLLS